MTMVYNSKRYALLNSDIELGWNLRRVVRYLQPKARDRILDIGCSRGFITRAVQRFAPDTTGIDLNPEAIASSVTGGLRVMDAQRLDFPTASFDKIYSFHVIEHIPDLGAALREMDRVLKPGGTLLLVYPAEPIRGLYVVPTATIVFGNPFRARDIHLHKLSPWRLRKYVAATSLRPVHSTLHLLLTPQFITVFRKSAAVQRQMTPAFAPELAAVGAS
ncbi:MAG: class I SAM-dependent methyltransferase [Gemmatimonadaceae bacterium]